VCTYYILCISWLLKCLIAIGARCKRENCERKFRAELVGQKCDGMRPDIIYIYIYIYIYSKMCVKFYLEQATRVEL